MPHSASGMRSAARAATRPPWLAPKAKMRPPKPSLCKKPIAAHSSSVSVNTVICVVRRYVSARAELPQKVRASEATPRSERQAASGKKSSAPPPKTGQNTAAARALPAGRVKIASVYLSPQGTEISSCVCLCMALLCAP